MASDRSGSEKELLTRFLDDQRDAILRKTAQLTRDQLAQTLPPSTMTLGGLLNHLALVEESWMEVRFSGLPEREPWTGVDWDADPDWEWHTAKDFEPIELRQRYTDASSGAARWSTKRAVSIRCRGNRPVPAADPSRCGGCSCISLRKPHDTPGMPTSSGSRSTARWGSDGPSRRFCGRPKLGAL
jgi:Protein of unknown function (DUF664)